MSSSNGVTLSGAIASEVEVMAKATRSVPSFLITQDHMAFLPAAPGDVLLAALWQNSVWNFRADHGVPASPCPRERQQLT